MKKMIALLIPATMMMSLLSGCASPSTATVPGTSIQTSGATTPATTTVETTTAQTSPSTTTPSTTVAATTTPSTTTAVESGPVGELADIIAAIYKIKPLEIMVETRPIDIKDADALKYNTGLTKVDQIKEVSVSESMIGSQAYSLVLVRVKSSADLEAVAKAMKAGIDPRKWICVEADDLRVVGSGDVVMLMMVSTELAEVVTTDEIVEAFKTVSGGTLSYEAK